MFIYFHVINNANQPFTNRNFNERFVFIFWFCPFQITVGSFKYHIWKI